MTVGASALAIGTGLALDRLVLPRLRSEQVAASDRAPGPSAARPSGGRSEPRAGAGTGGGVRDAPAAGPTAGTWVARPPKKKASPSASSTAPSQKTTTPAGGDRRPDGPAGSPGPEAVVVTLTNAERTKAGCKALRVDRRLTAAAREHSADMAANDYFDHDSPDGDSPWARMKDAGYPSPGAENIATGYPSAAAVVAGWMDSPGHRANILNCGLRAIGVGMAAGPDGPLWTQDFGWT